MKKLLEQFFNEWLKNHFPSIFEKEFFLISNWNWFLVLFIFFTGLVVFVLSRVILTWYIKRLWKKEAYSSDEYEASDTTLSFGVLSFSLNFIFWLKILDFPNEIYIFLNRASMVMTAISTVWVGLKIVDLLGIHFEGLAKKTDNKFDDVLVPLLKKASKVLVVSLGAVFVAHSLTLEIGSILAGLGIGGVAVALAAKDTISNVFGSVTLLIDRPFQIGDHVTLEKGIEGTIEEVGFRSTRIRTPYNSLVTIPNALLANIHVDNYGARKMRRFKTTLQLSPNLDGELIEELCERIRYLIKLNPLIHQENFQIHLNELTKDGLALNVTVFFETQVGSVEQIEKHRFLLEMIKLLKELKIQYFVQPQNMNS